MKENDIMEKSKEAEWTYFEYNMFMLPLFGFVLSLGSTYNILSSNEVVSNVNYLVLVLGLIAMATKFKRHKKMNTFKMNHSSIVVSLRNRRKHTILLSNIESFSSYSYLELVLKSGQSIKVDYSMFGLNVTDIKKIKEILNLQLGNY